MDNEKKHALTSLILWGVLAVIIFLIIIFILAMAFGKPKKAEGVEERTFPVITQVIEPSNLPDAILLPGRVEADVDVDLAAEQEGRIVDILVDKGEQVSKDELLLNIDSRTWEESLKNTRIEIDDAEKDLHRWENLRKTGAVALSDYEDIKKRKDLAETALGQAQIAISQCEARSPVDGYIEKRWVETGEYATKGMPLFKIVDIDPVKIIVNIPEQDILSIQENQQIPFSIAALNHLTLTGTVTFISKTADKSGNTYEAELTISNPNQILKPGMIADVRFTRAIEKDVVVIPLIAVIPDKGEYVIYVKEGDRAVRRVVRLARIIGHDVILKSGVSIGESVIIEGQRTLKDGALVTEQTNREEEPVSETEAETTT